MFRCTYGRKLDMKKLLTRFQTMQTFFSPISCHWYLPLAPRNVIHVKQSSQKLLRKVLLKLHYNAFIKDRKVLYE